MGNQFNIIFLKGFKTKINEFELKHCVFIDFLELRRTISIKQLKQK